MKGKERGELGASHGYKASFSLWTTRERERKRGSGLSSKFSVREVLFSNSGSGARGRGRKRKGGSTNQLSSLRCHYSLILAEGEISKLTYDVQSGCFCRASVSLASYHLALPSKKTRGCEC